MNRVSFSKIILFLILLLAISFRVYGIWWDQGFHLHPDERWIIMVADRIHMPKTHDEWNMLLTPESPLNPHFFAYGSFPIYLLKGVSSILSSADYGGMLLVGRMISVTFDVGTVLIIYLITKQLISKSKFLISNQIPKPNDKNVVNPLGQLEIRSIRNFAPLLASFFYAISVLPIQSSHFFISDIPLTFFTTLTLYFILKFMEKTWSWYTIFIGIALGFTLATKVTSILLVLPLSFTLFYHFIKFRSIKFTILSGLIIFLFSFFIFIFFMPYAVLDYVAFKQQMLEQTKMRVDPYIFPFTLQYVGTTPYWYFIKNILLYGLGIPLALLSFLGVFGVIGSVFNGIKHLKVNVFKNEYIASLVILLSYFIFFFGFIGNSAVKFMRYMLPIYPLFAIFGALFVGFFMNKFINRFSLSKKIGLLGYWIIGLLVILWPISFLSIYSRTHTRITADQWIHEHIPPGSTIAIEHWDDRLPLTNSEQYTFQELTLYDIPDDQTKWQILNDKLNKSDYIVIASNRLYVPLMRLTDCAVPRCYPITSKYYQDLFAGKRGFTKVAEFTSNPQFSIFHFPFSINDQEADESFTVYDHPKIMIFQKTNPNPPGTQ